MRLARLLTIAGVLLGGQAAGQTPNAHHHHGAPDPAGMVMNANDSVLPRDCAELSGEHVFEVEAGARFARGRPGLTWGYSRNEFRVRPCSRVTVTLVNRDEVRHQWMVHGLPRYLYPGGMFHIEAAGGQRLTGSFIVPSDDATYLVHCDMAQHMEKGMKAQLVVGSGGDGLWAVPGVSAPLRADSYLGPRYPAWLAGGALAGLLLALILQTLRARRPGRGPVGDGPPR